MQNILRLSGIVTVVFAVLGWIQFGTAADATTAGATSQQTPPGSAAPRSSPFAAGRFGSTNFGTTTVAQTRPVAQIFDVLYGDGQRTEAVVYHWDEILTGTDPNTGEQYNLWIPEWSRLEIVGGIYTFHLTRENSPFAPRWSLELQDVSFPWPPRVKDPAFCDKPQKRVVLVANDDKRLVCSQTPSPEQKGMEDPCVKAAERQYQLCPSLFRPQSDERQSSGPNTLAGNWLEFDDIQGRPLVIADRSEGDEVIRRCMDGDLRACGQIRQQYKKVATGTKPQTRCKIKVNGEEMEHRQSVDREECAFHAYFSALRRKCRPPLCPSSFSWSGVANPTAAPLPWQPIPFPPPLDFHERLFPRSEDRPISFMERVERCLREEFPSCKRVQAAYLRLSQGLGIVQEPVNCFTDVGGQRFHVTTVDEEECAFNAYFEALQVACLPGCNVRYNWYPESRIRPKDASAYRPRNGWKPLPIPPPVDLHQRLLDGNDW